MSKDTTGQVISGTWVEIHCILLEPTERTVQCPAETRQVPLEMRVKGFLTTSAAVGEEVEIVTPTGRRLQGTLSTVNPGYTHSFGSPILELLSIGGEVRAILHGRGHRR